MDLPIEVRGQATEREHLDALTAMQRRVGTRGRALVLCLGVPLCLVAVSVLSGATLEQALFANLFWLVFGALLALVGLPIARRETVRSMVKGNPDATAPTLYRFTAEGFEERECPVEVTIKWGSIQEALWTAHPTAVHRANQATTQMRSWRPASSTRFASCLGSAWEPRGPPATSNRDPDSDTTPFSGGSPGGDLSRNLSGQ